MKRSLHENDSHRGRARRASEIGRQKRAKAPKAQKTAVTPRPRPALTAAFGPFGVPSFLAPVKP